jgi:Zn-dependent oligopeptidase
MPLDLIDKKIKSRNEHAASDTLYQLKLATIDLLLNSATDQKALVTTDKPNLV